MVIESLKAAITALKEAMKEKGVPESSMKKMQESETGLQKLLVKAREAASQEAGYGEEEGGMDGMSGEEGAGHIDPHSVKPGHKIKKTLTVQHDGPADDGEEEEEEGGDEPDTKDEKDEKDAAEESRKVHLTMLLKEAGIPEAICSTEKLMKVSLKEAKAIIAEKKAEIELVRKSVEEGTDFVPTGEAMHESSGGENLNSLFTGCAE